MAMPFEKRLLKRTPITPSRSERKLSIATIIFDLRRP
jgi:hypothetical protein